MEEKEKVKSPFEQRCEPSEVGQVVHLPSHNPKLCLRSRQQAQSLSNCMQPPGAIGFGSATIGTVNQSVVLAEATAKSHGWCDDAKEELFHLDPSRGVNQTTLDSVPPAPSLEFENDTYKVPPVVSDIPEYQLPLNTSRQPEVMEGIYVDPPPTSSSSSNSDKSPYQFPPESIYVLPPRSGPFVDHSSSSFLTETRWPSEKVGSQRRWEAGSNARYQTSYSEESCDISNYGEATGGADSCFDYPRRASPVVLPPPVPSRDLIRLPRAAPECLGPESQVNTTPAPALSRLANKLLSPTTNHQLDFPNHENSDPNNTSHRSLAGLNTIEPNASRNLSFLSHSFDGPQSQRRDSNPITIPQSGFFDNRTTYYPSNTSEVSDSGSECSSASNVCSIAGERNAPNVLRKDERSSLENGVMKTLGRSPPGYTPIASGASRPHQDETSSQIPAFNYSLNQKKVPPTIRKVPQSKIMDNFPKSIAENIYLDSDQAMRLAHCHNNLKSQEWFDDNITIESAAAVLNRHGVEGSFIVRNSRKKDGSSYALSLFASKRVTNLNIRLRPDGFYALGKEKPGDQEKTFRSVEDVIVFYKSHKIPLIDGKMVKLTQSFANET